MGKTSKLRKTPEIVQNVTKTRIGKLLVQSGFLIRGLLYVAVGLFGILSIFDLSRSPENPSQILSQVPILPQGKVLLVFIVVGLVSYGLWEIVRIFQENQNESSQVKRAFTSLGYAISAASYFILALPAVQVILTNGQSQILNTRDVVQNIVNQPLGSPAILLVGGGLVIAGLAQFAYAYSKGFKANLDNRDMKHKEKKIVYFLGRYGYFVRGLLYLLLGVALVQSGMFLQSSDNVSYAGILQVIRTLPFGPYLLGIASLGLVALGLFSVSQVKWNKMNNSGATS